MPLTNAYASVAEMKQRLGISADDLSEDDRLETILTVCSREADEFCGRRFYAATETRYLVAANPYRLILDQDLRSVTTLKTDEGGDRTYEYTWSASTDYYLCPANAVADGVPYTEIEVDRVNGRYTFPVGIQRGIEIVGSWGYCATGNHPAPVREAVLRRADYRYKYVSAPLGTTGSPETGIITIRQDPNFKQLLWPYDRRLGFA